MPSFIRDLAALDRSSTPDVGGKAASLGELIGAGFPIPSGFVVTTATYLKSSDPGPVRSLVESLVRATPSSRQRSSRPGRSRPTPPPAPKPRRG